MAQHKDSAAVKLQGWFRELEQCRRQVELGDQVMQMLSPEERIILQKMIIEPKWGNALLLGQMLQVEPDTIYKKKSRLIRKLEKLLRAADGAASRR